MSIKNVYHYKVYKLENIVAKKETKKFCSKKEEKKSVN